MNPFRHSADRMPCRSTLRTIGRAAVLATLLAGAAGSASAQANDWQWTATPYVWATDVGVDVKLDDRQVVDETVKFQDLLESVDAVAQLRLEAQRGAHGAMLDLFAVGLSEEDSRVTLPGNSGAAATLDSEVTMTILEAGGIYDPRGDHAGFALLYGTRVLYQRAEIDGRFELGSTTTTNRDYEVSDTLVDGLVGFQYTHRFSPRLSTQSRIDVSAGGTDLTWSAGSTLSYALGQRGRYAVSAGYRRMTVDFEDEGSLSADMTLSGFMAGLRASF